MQSNDSEVHMRGLIDVLQHKFTVCPMNHVDYLHDRCLPCQLFTLHSSIPLIFFGRTIYVQISEIVRKTNDFL